MTTFEPAAACARFADLVPLVGDDALDAANAALVRQHLRGCASCRALEDQYTRLDSTLRQRFGLATVQRRSSEEIMRYIADRAPQPASNTARRVHLPRRRILSGLAAAASILVALGITGLLFGSRLGFGPGAHLGPARYSFPTTKGSFASISMVSPTEGWALGQILKAPDGQRSLSEVTLYHLLNGAWTPVYVPTSANFGDGGVSGFNGTISMDSATDGWAVAHNFNRFSVVLHYTNGAWTQVTAPDLWTVQALGPQSVWAITGLYDGRPTGLAHYDGSAWTPQTLPVATTAQTGGVVAFHMLSDSEGWALATPDGSTYTMLHFAGGAWTVHSSFSAGQFSDFSAFAMVSSSEGWALGQKIAADTHGNTAHVPLKQLVYHHRLALCHAAADHDGLSQRRVDRRRRAGVLSRSDHQRLSAAHDSATLRCGAVGAGAGAADGHARRRDHRAGVHRGRSRLGVWLYQQYPGVEHCAGHGHPRASVTAALVVPGRRVDAVPATVASA